MSSNPSTKPREFYLVSVDIIQGVCVFFIVTFHTLLWWDPSIDTRWPNITNPAAIFMTIAQLVPPGLFFLYGFNIVNSLLRKKTRSERLDSRIRLLKRTIIFFLLAEVFEGLTALVNSPELILNYLLTWELFHLFSFSTFFLLCIFELSWKLESKRYKRPRQTSLLCFLVILILIIFVFILFHDYSMYKFQGFYVEVEIDSLIHRVLFEDGQAPIIPWLIFPVLGGFFASYLDLPHKNKENILEKSMVSIAGGLITLIIGGILLTQEGFVSPPFLYPASTSLVFISMAFYLIITFVMILIFDLYSIYSHPVIQRLVSPLALVGNILFTVYVIHNIGFIIPPQIKLIQIILSSETTALTAGFLYSLFFVLLARIWHKWKFKFSLEWLISKLQTLKWKP